MKSLRIFKLATLAFACLLIAASCVKEGPIGPAGLNGNDGADGSDGKDGVDGNVTCLVCHSGENLKAKQAQFAMSVHSSGAIAVDYAGGRAGCTPCHSHEQFVQFAEFGKVAGNITNPSAWECSTCHGIHQTFEGSDYALRLKDPVVSNFDNSITLDMGGNSNLCANCHQSRTPAPKDIDQFSRSGALVNGAGDGLFAITSTHYGPHHGAQANVIYGVGFAEIPGSVDYPTPGASNHLTQASCTGCHMGDFVGGQGGHSFNPSLAACNSCHSQESDDFNYGGVRSDITSKLNELRDKLLSLGVIEYAEEGEWIWDPETGEHKQVEIHGSYHPKVGTFPIIQTEAFFNWIGLVEDRSLGAHNPKYVKALLINTIEALQ